MAWVDDRRRPRNCSTKQPTTHQPMTAKTKNAKSEKLSEIRTDLILIEYAAKKNARDLADFATHMLTLSDRHTRPSVNIRATINQIDKLL